MPDLITLSKLPAQFLLNRAQRNTTVIRALRRVRVRLNPPPDFDGVYAHALANYQDQNPHGAAMFFRHSDTKRAFRAALEQDSLAPFRASVVDVPPPDSQLAAFTTIFYEIARQTRHPKEVIHDRTLSELLEQVEVIRMRLETAGAPSNPVQAAAVCYRRTAQGVEFLLVQTNGRRWTFPKGGIDPGMTETAAAKQEAFEEAGVRGAVETEPLTSYLHSKRDMKRLGRGKEFTVNAYLFEVRDEHDPMEEGRNPTWFGPQDAKRQLALDRELKYAEELERVVDEAVQRLAG